MYEKKWLIALVVLVSLSSVFFVYVFLNKYDTLTAGATAGTGEVSFCINNPPSITAIADQNATSGAAFSLTVTASDSDSGQTLSYADNTSLFAISSSGVISFTPTSSDVGAHDILITVSDNSACTGRSATDVFTLTIAAGTEPSPSPAPSGGGGGGGGGRGIAEKFLPFRIIPDDELGGGRIDDKTVYNVSFRVTDSDGDMATRYVKITVK